MRSLYFILEKEFNQLKRRKGLVRMLLIAPIIQLILLPMAANFSVKNISLVVVDNDYSSTSQQLIKKITASGHFKLYATAKNNQEALNYIEHDLADVAIEIPNHFEKNLIREGREKIDLQINAIEGVKGGLSGSYLGQIISDFNKEWTEKYVMPQLNLASVRVISTHWYNPFLNYYIFIVPGILVNLITGIGLMQAAFNMVNEKK
ncbi:MAG: ABC transporter permease [Chitinophagaceae bacterium]